MFRLYHREGAGRPRRVRWALEETGAPYEWIVLDEVSGHSAEHARRHPLGRVPVLETDDGMLYESAALCLHVADLYPDAKLIPPLGSFDARADLPVVVLRNDRAGACDDPHPAGAARR